MYLFVWLSHEFYRCDDVISVVPANPLPSDPAVVAAMDIGYSRNDALWAANQLKTQGRLLQCLHLFC